MHNTTLLARAEIEGTPLISGETATLLWQGDDPPTLLGDFNGWNAANAHAPLPADGGLWTYTLRLPRDAYIEYGFMRDGAHLPDPYNRRVTVNGFGGYSNYFYMPDAEPTPFAQPPRGAPRGTLTRHVIPAEIHGIQLFATHTRAVALYRPPVAGPYPLLVVFDGAEYRRRARLPAIIDSLISARRIRPIALALVDNGGTARMAEYACSDATLLFLYNVVLPLARAQLDLVDLEDHPGAYGVLGASMGGLMALYCGLRTPSTFGRVLSQSGAFSIDGFEFAGVDLVREGAVRPIEIQMSVGRFEQLLESNRRMHALLVARGYQVGYREFNAGHNYPAWRDDLSPGLEALFPPAVL